MFRRIVALLLVFTVIATACGGDDEPAAAGDGAPGEANDSTATSDDEPAAAGDGATGEADDSTARSDDDTSADAAAPDGDSAPSTGVASTIAWTAPDGLDPVAVAVSPDGASVALGFAGLPGFESTPGEVIVYDVASGSELWRAPVDDVGFAGLNLVYSTAGLSVVAATLEGTSTATTYADGAAVSEVVIGDTGCGQFLNGAVDPDAPAFYTVVPSGVCRIDLTTGEAVAIDLSDVVSTNGLVNSIRFDVDGALLMSYSADLEDGTGFFDDAAIVDPASFTVTEPMTGREEPLSAGDRFGDRLEDGIGTASSDNRTSQTPDGSVVALMQPGRIDIIR